MNPFRRKTVAICAVMLASTSGVLVAVYWYYDLGHAAVEEIPNLHGKAIEEVIRKLGEPDSQLSYTMGNSPGGELRGPLFFYYPPERPDNREVAIKELWWEHSRYTVVVWFHKMGEQWIALDTCRWKKGVQF